jgi:hypothetical protein
MRVLCGELLQAQLELLRPKDGQSSDTFSEQSCEDVYKLVSQDTFDRMLSESFPLLTFHRTSNDLAHCNECVVLRSAFVHSAGDAVRRAQVTEALGCHLSINSHNRRIFSTLREIALRAPFDILVMGGDQCWPGYIPHPSKTPKDMQRTTGVGMEIAGVVLSWTASGSPFLRNRTSACNVFTYPSTTYAEWPSVPGTPPVSEHARSY